MHVWLDLVCRYSSHVCTHAYIHGHTHQFRFSFEKQTGCNIWCICCVTASPALRRVLSGCSRMRAHVPCTCMHACMRGTRVMYFKHQHNLMARMARGQVSQYERAWFVSACLFFTHVARWRESHKRAAATDLIPTRTHTQTQTFSDSLHACFHASLPNKRRLF